VGLTRDEVVGLRGQAEEMPFSDPADLALLGWIEVTALGPGAPPTVAADRLGEHFSESEIVELTLLVGATLMLNRFATGLGLPTSVETLQRLAREGLASEAA